MGEIQTFLHKTFPGFLPLIFASNKLSSPVSRGEKSPSWYDGSYVYLTPQNNKNIYKEKGAAILHFDAKSLIRDYPKFFINNGNSFGPLNGRGVAGKDCGCKWTYNTIVELDGPCVKHSLEEIESVLKYDMSKCDGGPEIGFPGEIDLLPYLTKITMPQKQFVDIKSKIPEKYLQYIETFTHLAGGTRKKATIARRYDRRSRKTRFRVPFVDCKSI